MPVVLPVVAAAGNLMGCCTYTVTHRTSLASVAEHGMLTDVTGATTGTPADKPSTTIVTSRTAENIDAGEEAATMSGAALALGC